MRAMIDLAQHEGKQPLQLRTIAKRQDISMKYLEQLMTLLRSAGFVRSVRGSKGGYVLAKALEKITLSDIFRCLEGPVTTTECVEDENYCTRVSECIARRVWVRVEDAIDGVLKSITLRDLADEAKKENKNEYQI
jgi:Rrf2 family protein